VGKTANFFSLIGRATLLLCICLAHASLSAQTLASQTFLLRFVDAKTRRPIPLVEAELFNALRLCSDNLGNMAILEPDLAGRQVRLRIRGHGYRYPQLDFFGERAISLAIKPGSVTEIELERTVAAERLYRITGSGRFRDSILGRLTSRPDDLPGRVTGLDSAIPVVWQNRLFCFYGDTLGTDRLNLSGSGAEVITGTGVPEEALPLNFFCDPDGFASRMIELPEPGFIWIETVIPVMAGKRELLVARYVKHKTLEEAVETGFALFNPLQQKFMPVKKFKSARHHKSAHAVRVHIDNRPAWCIQPWERTGINLKDFINPQTYAFYTCLEPLAPEEKAQTLEFDGKKLKVKRDAAGKPVFSWVSNGIPFSPANQKLLLKAGIISQNERWLELTEIGTGHKISDFSGSISWNDYRNRWIMISQGQVGEIWFSEADTFTGPWVYARRIVEHDGYNFYNPVHHSWFDDEHGRIIYLEGTYTSFFTREEYKTPRADYNQVMYRLDLADASLRLPVPVYRVNLGKNTWRLMTREAVARQKLWNQIVAVEFFAFADNDSQNPHLQAVYDHATESDKAPVLKLVPSAAGPIFFTIRNNPQALAELGFAESLTVSANGIVFKNTSDCLTIDPTILPQVNALNRAGN